METELSLMKPWTVFVAVVLAGAFSLEATTLKPARAQEVQLPVVAMPDRPQPPAATPPLDVSVSCEAAAAVAISAGRDKDACLSDEKEARDQLGKDWAAAQPDDKSLCFGNVETGGPPSYVELESCLSVMKDYRQIRESDPLMMAEIHPPTPPALPHRYRECQEPMALWCLRPAGRLWFGDRATLARERGARHSRRHGGDRLGDARPPGRQHTAAKAH
jgi:hypothetical protein